MSSKHLTDVVKTIVVSNAEGAATSDINCAVVDTNGFGALRYIVQFGTITSGAVTSVKAQQGTQVGGGDMADLLGSGITVADDDDDKVFIIDIKNPDERYSRCVIDRGTQNAVIESVIAELYDPRTAAVTQDSTVGGSEQHDAPAEGTA